MNRQSGAKIEICRNPKIWKNLNPTLKKLNVASILQKSSKIINENKKKIAIQKFPNSKNSTN